MRAATTQAAAITNGVSGTTNIAQGAGYSDAGTAAQKSSATPTSTRPTPTMHRHDQIEPDPHHPARSRISRPLRRPARHTPRRGRRGDAAGRGQSQQGMDHGAARLAAGSVARGAAHHADDAHQQGTGRRSDQHRLDRLVLDVGRPSCRSAWVAFSRSCCEVSRTASMPRRAAASACDVTLFSIGAAWLRTSSTFSDRRSSAESAARCVERMAFWAPCRRPCRPLSWPCWREGLVGGAADRCSSKFLC